jgi:hypothetical protein
MNARLVSLVSALALTSVALAADPKEAAGRYGAKPLKGDYYVYGGSLGDSVPPTAKDRKVAMMFTGPLAKELFGQIGPDQKNACGDGPDHRTRLRGDLSCVWQKDDGYACYFGLDVPTGKSTYGSIC